VSPNLGFSQATWPWHINKVYLSIYLSVNIQTVYKLQGKLRKWNYKSMITVLRKCPYFLKKVTTNKGGTSGSEGPLEAYWKHMSLLLFRKHPARKVPFKLCFKKDCLHSRYFPWFFFFKEVAWQSGQHVRLSQSGSPRFKFHSSHLLDLFSVFLSSNPRPHL